MKENKRPRIGIGFRVGMLEVISSTSLRKNGYNIWNCKCDCGNMIQLDTRCLQRGSVKDCGCNTQVKPGQRDLAGMRFGKLVAVEPTEQRAKNGTVVWCCRCDCGNEILVSMGQLLNGYRKSCNCLSKPPLKNWIGKRFGKLMVISYDGKKGGCHFWICKCDCGNTVSVRQSNLKGGKTSSCGCLADIRKKVHYVDGTCIELIQSRKLSKNNTSGIRGVYRNKNSNKWVAKITFKGKQYNLGSYTEKEDAAKARKEAEDRLFGGFLEWYYNDFMKNRG